MCDLINIKSEFIKFSTNSQEYRTAKSIKQKNSNDNVILTREDEENTVIAMKK